LQSTSPRPMRPPISTPQITNCSLGTQAA
jgi:hypothetical protein